MKCDSVATSRWSLAGLIHRHPSTTAAATPDRLDVNFNSSPAARSSSWRSIVPRTALVLALSAGLPPTVALVAGGAMAAEPVTMLAQSFGVTPQTIQAATVRSSTPLVESVPANLRAAWRVMPRTERTDMDGGFQGSTFGVSHKTAFINGSAMGFNVFDSARSDIDGKLAKKVITQQAHDDYIRLFEAARNLTPQQRQAFMAVMDSDCGH